MAEMNENFDQEDDAHQAFDGDIDKLDILKKLDEDPEYQGPGTDQVETWTDLNLRGLRDRIPDSILRCKSLRTLDVSNNSQLDKEQIEKICRLKTMEELDMSNSSISTKSPDIDLSIMPPDTLQLQMRKTLRPPDVFHDKFQMTLDEFELLQEVFTTTIFPLISQLKNLKKLNLSNNNFNRVPLPLCEIVNLESLDISKNSIRRMAPEISQLENLKELNLSDTELINYALEEELFPVWKLVKLEILDLSSNSISTLPPQLSQLKNLKKLNLSWNELKEIALPVCKLLRLESLNLAANSIKAVPPQISKLQNLKELNISDNILKEIPLPVCELVRLEALNVLGNLITTVPPQIAKLKNLKKFNLAFNRMKKLPLPLWGLMTLETLILSGTNITEVPHEISNLKNLKELNMSDNKLVELPMQVCELLTLETLNLSGTNITAVPPEISKLKNLKELNMSDNKLVELTLPVCELVRLEVLNLWGNHITMMPQQISKLEKLKKLNLSCNWLEEVTLPMCELVQLETLDLLKNPITTLPHQITKLKNLKELKLDRKQLTQPPFEIADRGKDAIFRYFHDLISTKATTSSRLQVHILGETCAGKTSLVKTLTSGSPFLTAIADRTHVLEQIVWSPKEDVFININDFGGHDVYRVAHNFFLTKEALTLIVFDLQDVNLRYKHSVGDWIENVYDRAPDSMMLLVGSHADCMSNEQELEARKKGVLSAVMSYKVDKEFKLRTSLEELEKKSEFKELYPQSYNEKMNHIKKLIEKPPRVDKRVFVTSSKTGYGIAELKEELVRRAKENKLVLPETWLQKVEDIETAKQNRQDPFLTLDSLAKMSERGHDDAQRTEDVLNFLRGTGAVLWFKDKPLLKTFIFHRQEVFIDILRAVLRHDIDLVLAYGTNPFNKKYTERKFKCAREDVLRRGVVSKTMLECLWWRFNFGKSGLDAMLELLENFEICYVVKSDDENRYHFPWLLREDQPECISSKWPAVPARQKLQISTEIHFPTACPPALYEMAAVHLHDCLGHYKSARQDWKDGFYAELDNQFQMCFERRVSEKSSNGILRLSIRGEDPVKLKEHCLLIFQKLINLVGRECPGSPRDEYVVCPHCVREQKNLPTLFDAPKNILSVYLEEQAPYHPCPEENPNTLASADFFYPVTQGKMTVLHCTSLEKHANHTLKVIRNTFNGLRKILSRLCKAGILTEEEKKAILEPDADDRLSSFLKRKSDLAFYVFCGALHDSGNAETAWMLRLPDFAMKLPEHALGEVLERLLEKKAITRQDRDAVWREPYKELRISALVRKLREGKRDYEAERAFNEFGDAIDEEIAKQNVSKVCNLCKLLFSL
ncbi:malignant fibrous histiocytoma-amplified sequence 1 homolog [Lingula anatina]|uniref:non-specific serine/threonine protein kinase n=1 Tax=Lingula anatina TaxID=7574 RepID=A0A1S3KC03_LINAN|nr:malignant fibrous histiocytoma-amplified sequence 1 homolog [Lingula anatina]|eukprot:XP_013419969.1 malignant fibrous histiocytoma-amplified sequence 1 homolog [Lingula anatina]